MNYPNARVGRGCDPKRFTSACGEKLGLRAISVGIATAFSLVLLAGAAGALTVTQTIAGKSEGFNFIAVGAGSTVTISVPIVNHVRVKPCPCAPTATPTFTWNLYDADNGFREQGAVDFTQTSATPPPNTVFSPGCPASGWVCTLPAAGQQLVQGSWDYTYTDLPALTLPAGDIIDSPADAYVEVIATLGADTATNDQCTPDLPSVGQGDLGVQQAPGSIAPMSNATGLSTYPIRAFSRGHDEIWDLLDGGSGVDPGVFLSSQSFTGTLPSAVDTGSLLLFSAPASGRACTDEPAGGVGQDLSISFFNLNTGAPGSGLATDEYYFVRENDTLIEYSAAGDIDSSVSFFDLDDLSGRYVSALAVGDSGTRGVFEVDDHLVYAYEGSTEIWVQTGPLGVPAILSANGLTFNGLATFDFGHFGEDGLPGASVTPSGSITSISIASNLSNIQPVPSDRAYPDYDHVPLPAFFDDFVTGSVALFTDVAGTVFDFENDPTTFGGQREVHVDVSSTTGNGAFLSTTNGVYIHDQSDEVLARSEVIWDGTDASEGVPGDGSLGLDLDADPANAFLIKIRRMENFSAGTFLPSIGAFVELDEPGRPRSEMMLPFTGPLVEYEDLILPFQLFGPNLSNVASVGLVINGMSGFDFVSEISSITTTAVNTYPPIVDAFNDPQISISRTTVGSEFVAYRNPITMSGEVEVTAEVFLSGNIGNLDITGDGNSLLWSQGMMVLAGGSIVWDGMDSNPTTDLTTAVNLTQQAADAIELTIDSLLFDGPVTGGVGISFSLVSRANPSEFFVSPAFQLTSPITEGQTIIVPFMSLLGEGSGAPSMAELSEVASLSLQIDGGAQSEFSLALGELRTISVPEPGLMSSLVAGLLVLAASHRRRTSM